MPDNKFFNTQLVTKAQVEKNKKGAKDVKEVRRDLDLEKLENSHKRDEDFQNAINWAKTMIIYIGVPSAFLFVAAVIVRLFWIGDDDALKYWVVGVVSSAFSAVLGYKFNTGENSSDSS